MIKSYCALSIVFPSVSNIILKLKTVEIRSWLPPSIPFNDLVLVENNNYLKKGEVDEHGKALAIVDVISCNEWTFDIYKSQSNATKHNKKWKEGYFIWELSNIRLISPGIICEAKTGIYELQIDDDFVCR